MSKYHEQKKVQVFEGGHSQTKPKSEYENQHGWIASLAETSGLLSDDFYENIARRNVEFDKWFAKHESQ